MNETAILEILRVSSNFTPLFYVGIEPFSYTFPWGWAAYYLGIIVSLVVLCRLWQKHPGYKLLGKEDFPTFFQPMRQILSSFSHFDDGITSHKTSRGGRVLYWTIYCGSIGLLLWFLYRAAVIVMEMRDLGMV